MKNKMLQSACLCFAIIQFNAACLCGACRAETDPNSYQQTNRGRIIDAVLPNPPFENVAGKQAPLEIQFLTGQAQQVQPKMSQTPPVMHTRAAHSDGYIRKVFEFVKTDPYNGLPHLDILHKLALTDPDRTKDFRTDIQELASFQELIENVCLPYVKNENLAVETRTSYAYQAAGIIKSLGLPAETAEKAIDAITSLANSLDKNPDGYRIAVNSLALITKAHPKLREEVVKKLCLDERQSGIYRDFGVILVEKEKEFSDEELAVIKEFLYEFGPKLLARTGAIIYEVAKKGSDTRTSIQFCGGITVHIHDTKAANEYFKTDKSCVQANAYTMGLLRAAAYLFDSHLNLYSGMDTSFYRINDRLCKSAQGCAKPGLEGASDFFVFTIEHWGADSVYSLNTAISLANEGDSLFLQAFLGAAEIFSFKKDGKEYTKLFKTDAKGNVDCSIVPIERDENGIISKIGDTEIKPGWIMKDVW